MHNWYLLTRELKEWNKIYTIPGGASDMLVNIKLHIGAYKLINVYWKRTCRISGRNDSAYLWYNVYVV